MTPSTAQLFVKACLCFLPLLPLVACKQGRPQSAMQGAKPGETRSFELTEGILLDFQWIPPGEFIMGSPGNEFGRSHHEAQRVMRVHTGFWMSRHEVSRKTWHRVMGTEFPPQPRDADRPVADVNWNDCVDFISRLRRPAADWAYRLPSERQWEYACRAGSPDEFHGAPLEVAWLDRNSRSRSHPCGQLKPNLWGLHDMHGNVAEWCRDHAGSGRGSERVIRGGSWDSDLSARAAARNSDTPHLSVDRVGFRIVLEPNDNLISPKNPNIDNL